MAISENARKLKAIRSRAIGLRELGRAIGWDASRYQYYEDQYKKLYIPSELVEIIRPHLVGRGDPPVTDAELNSLLPPPPSLPAASEPPTDIIGSSTVTHLPFPTGTPDVPVWASAQAGDDGAMVLTSEPIDYIRRSERMLTVRNPFAFYVLGYSMSPAIEQGDQVVIHPAMPPQAGKDCVFIHEAPDGTMLAMVKRLLRVTPDQWKVRQFNPARDFDLSRKKWSRALMIAEKRVL